MASLWLPHWSGSLYVLIVMGYLFPTFRWRGAVAGGIIMALIWLILALAWDIPNQGLLAEKIAALFSVSRPVLWLMTTLIGFLLGSVGIAIGQALYAILPQKPPKLRGEG
ncbi:MAG: hypothetical protein NZ580_03645 [Bacteroidia bacterium]|nr:hypothetical protein [Bacteroidia bacterium]MDW8235142.1 hypothetical protein [Bacteroidia bacterium]